MISICKLALVVGLSLLILGLARRQHLGYMEQNLLSTSYKRILYLIFVIKVPIHLSLGLK